MQVTGAGVGGGWGVGIGMERGWRVGIWSRMSEYRVWVVAEALALEWKGRRGWGCGHVCLKTQVREAGVGGR